MAQNEVGSKCENYTSQKNKWQNKKEHGTKLVHTQKLVVCLAVPRFQQVQQEFGVLIQPLLHSNVEHRKSGKSEFVVHKTVLNKVDVTSDQCDYSNNFWSLWQCDIQIE
jgi:hypothetical protein